MDEDGGKSKYSSNKAGAKYGTGYCDAQCPRDLKFINGEANVDGWKASSNDENAGVGNYGSCCSEMDIWCAPHHFSLLFSLLFFSFLSLFSFFFFFSSHSTCRLPLTQHQGGQLHLDCVHPSSLHHGRPAQVPGRFLRRDVLSRPLRRNLRPRWMRLQHLPPRSQEFLRPGNDG